MSGHRDLVLSSFNVDVTINAFIFYNYIIFSLESMNKSIIFAHFHCSHFSYKTHYCFKLITLVQIFKKYILLNAFQNENAWVFWNCYAE